MVWREVVCGLDNRKCTKCTSLQCLVKDGMVLGFRDSVLCVWLMFIYDLWARVS